MPILQEVKRDDRYRRMERFVGAMFATGAVFGFIVGFIVGRWF